MTNFKCNFKKHCVMSYRREIVKNKGLFFPLNGIVIEDFFPSWIGEGEEFPEGFEKKEEK